MRKDIERTRAKGRPIQVFVNMLALQFTKNSVDSIIHYDIDFDEKTPKNQYRVILDKICKKNFERTFPAYDGKKNLYAARELFSKQQVSFKICNFLCILNILEQYCLNNS